MLFVFNFQHVSILHYKTRFEGEDITTTYYINTFGKKKNDNGLTKFITEKVRVTST